MCCGKMRRDVHELAAILQLNTKSVIQHSGCLHTKSLKHNKTEFPNKALTDWEFTSVLLDIQARSAVQDDDQQFEKSK